MHPLPPLVDPTPSLGRDQYRRHSRQMLLGELGQLGQRRLQASRVAVVGAGGLGSPVIQYLAAAGVGHLTVIDDDVVEISNLHRQVIHSSADQGLPKVDSAARAVHALDPEVEVSAVGARLTQDSVDAVLGGHDVVVDGTDNFPTRYLISDACSRLGIPEVWGSVLGFDAQVSVFWDALPPGSQDLGRTLRDLFPHPPTPGAVPSCAEAGVVGALCGQVGSVMAMEVVKLLTGIGQPLLGRVLVIDALSSDVTTLDFARAPRTPHSPAVQAPPSSEWVGGACGTGPLGLSPLPSPPDADSLSVPALRDLLGRDPAPLLLDVREWEERAQGAIPGSMWVPLGDIMDGTGLDRLPPGAEIVVYCHAGVRSALARDVLEERGWPGTRDLAGGILSWSAAGLETPPAREPRP